MNNLFMIGEISKLFQIDIRTLRYYDEIDLFKPAEVEINTGYRYYSIDQFEQLNTILYLKTLGIPLKNIKQFLDHRDIDHILQLLQEQHRRTEQKINEFMQIKKKIESRMEQINDAANTSELYKIRETELPERSIVLLKQKIHRSDNLELPIRMLENKTKMKSTIFLGKVGLSITMDSLLAGCFDQYDSIFVVIEEEARGQSEEKRLPKNKYVTLRFAGTHEDAAPYYKQLMKYIEEKRYLILDDGLEITYIDYGLTHDVSKFVTEIQIPVK
ncbi:MerR family transcriptional regulator [Neobacillus mesonae]|nr:MerR family transcriptional regulator [Neobacillus mesonae]